MSEKQMSLRDALRSVREKIAEVAPRGVNVDRVILDAVLAVNASERLRGCTQASLVQAVIQIAAWGETIGVTAHLVPYKTTATAQRNVRGIVRAMVQSGEVMSVEARTVTANEDAEGRFRVEYGTDPKILHTPNIGDDSEIVAAYAVFTLPDGTKKFEVVSRADIEQARAKSQSGNAGPWRDWYGEMAKKVAVKRGAKLIPWSARVNDIIVDDDREYREYLGEEVKGSSAPVALPREKGKSRRVAALVAPNPLDAVPEGTAAEQVEVGADD